MRFALIALCLLPAAVLAADDEEKLVPLIRVRDADTREYLYFYDDSDKSVWKQDPKKYTEPKTIGFAPTLESNVTGRLYHAKKRTRDELHLYYLAANPRYAKHIDVDEDYQLLVWTRKALSLEAIHGCSAPDGSYAFFDPDWETVQKAAKDLQAGKGLKPIIRRNVFYLKEPPK